MINYCKTHFKPIGDKSGHSITFAENNYYSKKVINSDSSSSGSKVRIVLQGEDNGMPPFIGSKSYSKSQIDTFISNLNKTISGILINLIPWRQFMSTVKTFLRHFNQMLQNSKIHVKMLQNVLNQSKATAMNSVNS